MDVYEIVFRKLMFTTQWDSDTSEYIGELDTVEWLESFASYYDNVGINHCLIYLM